MKIINKLFLSIFAIFSFTLFTSVANAACGKITIANMNWASANFMAEVDKVILEKGYGCDVELVPGSTMPTSPRRSFKRWISYLPSRMEL